MLIDRYSVASRYTGINLFVFFFKLKSTYEMLSSDWSLDVCSSDLNALVLAQEHVDIGRDRPRLRDAGDLPHFDIELARRLAAIVEGSREHPLRERFQDLLLLLQRNQIGRTSCMERGCQYV